MRLLFWDVYYLLGVDIASGTGERGLANRKIHLTKKPSGDLP
jgi:hypothetical protein